MSGQSYTSAVPADALLSLAVCPVSLSDQVAAASLASRLALPLVASDYTLENEEYAALLVVEDEQLRLQKTGRAAPGPVQVEFGNAAMRHRRRGGANELLGRAVGVGKKAPLQILDATAGLARDAFVLADLGCQVCLCERHPVIGQLLAAGLHNAQMRQDDWLETVVARMRLQHSDARALPAREVAKADVIYLDPMFAPRGKSAAVKKEMALFQALLADTSTADDADQLLCWALEQDVARVVVKRALKAAPLAGVKPSHSIRGKAVRYDVHVLHKL